MTLRIIKYLCFLSLVPYCNAQQTDTLKIDWVSVGVGAGTQNSISVFFNYTFVNDNIYQLNLNKNEEFLIFDRNNADYYIYIFFHWN